MSLLCTCNLSQSLDFFVTCNFLLVAFSTAFHIFRFIHTLCHASFPCLSYFVSFCVGLTLSMSLWNIFSHLGLAAAGLLRSQNEGKLWTNFQGRDQKECLKQKARKRSQITRTVRAQRLQRSGYANIPFFKECYVFNLLPLHFPQDTVELGIHTSA